ncbi:MAG TPA: hypothetical protein VN923_08825, partial [Thermoanaerobaculia bacterium]|nr:hypothetical protein [Thermoanaerobaculia bacterium]
MNVNGSRFDLLLGRADWGRCLDGDDEGARTLASWWDGELQSPPVDPDPELPAWDARRRELSIRPLAIELPATPGETPVTLEARRGAAADRYGNVYSIGPDRRSLVVHSAGSRRATTFWPAEPAQCEAVRAQVRLDFAPPQPDDDGAEPESYLALTVTADDYLVVAFSRGSARGLLSFDLVAGGSPLETAWPAAVALEPFDMAKRCGGGVWLLDRVNRRLWELDCRLAVVSAAQPATTLIEDVLDDFQPLSGTPRERAAVTFPGGIDLAASPPWTIDPIAVEALADGAVLLLDVDEIADRSRVVRLRRDGQVNGQVWEADPSRWLDELPGLAHDFVFANGHLYQADEPVKQLFIVTSGGNQARAYTVQDSPTDFILGTATELFPLRRFGGRALIAIRCDAYYDSGIETLTWAPIVEQPRALFEPTALFVTPVFDSGEVGTTWDRVHVDACLPPDTAIEVRSRAGDERADLLDGAGSPSSSEVEAPQVVGTWLPEPLPHLRSTGSELPWLRAEAARPTRREAGVGTWELLLQNARGRYLQLEVRLKSGNGAATPRLRALRAWSPRFSYPQRFLPGVYREDATAGPFLERWLANVESTLTNFEDR